MNVPEQGEKKDKKLNKWAVILVAAASLVFLIIQYQVELRRFLDFIRDRQAIQAFIQEIGIIGPLICAALLAIQIFIPWLPAEPTMLASAYLYGFLFSFFIGWSVTVATSQLVYLIARRAGKPLVERFVPPKQLERWSALAREKGAIFFIFAFILPPIPTDMMIYVAGISGIGAWQFLWANLIGRMPLVLLYSLVAGYGFEITPLLISAVILLGIFLMGIWWYLVIRRK